MTHFVHCSDYVVLGYDSRIVSVELLEDGFEFLVVEEGLHVKGCDEELGVVDALVAKVVDLGDDLVYPVLGYVDVAFQNGLLELFSA